MDKLSQNLSALCDIIQIHQCFGTYSQHKRPSPLCTSDEDLLACIIKFPN
ncbi:hypothetical protein Hanom_Chr03g00252361 [Helianthus anomalus]